MSQVRTVVLDSEAVQALLDPRHPKHRHALALAEAAAARNLVRAGAVQVVVPTAVRVESGWVRTDRRSAGINRLRARDHDLAGSAADTAAAVAAALAVSVADAHLAAVLVSTPAPHAALTSDVQDLTRISRHAGVPVQVVRI